MKIAMKAIKMRKKNKKNQNKNCKNNKNNSYLNNSSSCSKLMKNKIIKN